MHIAFLTLFLGLVSGAVPVELTVSGAAAGNPSAAAGNQNTAIVKIELVLDGQVVRTLPGPQFRGTLDLGATLLPHHLVARGLDAERHELARTEQWLNLPQPPAEIEALPEALPQTGPDGRAAAVRLVFHSLLHETPGEVHAVLDDKPVAVTLDAGRQGARIALPPLAPDVAHLLTIEATYPSGLAARRDLAIGNGGEVATDLTAVPLRARRGTLPTVPAGLTGWFAAPLKVTAIEEGPGEVLVVRSPKVALSFELFGQQRVRKVLSPISVPLPLDGTPDSHFTALPDRLAALRTDMKLGSSVRVRFLHATSQRFADPGAVGSGAPVSELFPSSQPFTEEDGGLFWLLARVAEQEPGEARLADAVAVAGLQALTANHRRAVLLVLDRASDDASRYDPATVRAYLAAIHVPLYVWQVGKASPRTAALWGQVTALESLSDVSRAARDLARDLAAQRIVWLDGRHLPQTLKLTPAAAAKAELAAGRAR